MSDKTNTATPNIQAAIDQGKSGWGKAVSGLLSGIATTYVMNLASLHGVNFELLGIPSEMVKAGIDGVLVSGFVWATPPHFVAAVKDAILFIKDALRQWREAWNSN